MNKTNDKKLPVLLRLLAFLVTLALMLGAIAAVVYRDRINMDALKRWYTYRTLAKGDSGQAVAFTYEGRSGDLFAALDGDLLVCAPSGVRVYSPGGVAYVEDAATLAQPALTAAGGLAAVYDVGGTLLRVYDKRSLAADLEQTGAGGILAATLSSGGYLTVTARETGYKGVLTVYNPAQEPVISLRMSSRFLMDGVVTGSGAALAALAAGQNGSEFESLLLFYHLTDGEEPFASNSLGSCVIYNLDADSAGVWALGETGLWIFSEAGEQTGQYDFSDRYLKNASLDGDGFSALMLGRYRTGSATELVTVDAAGQVLGSLSLSEQVLSLSAAGRYLAVLTADRLELYTADLTPYASVTGTQGARSAVVQEDGSVFLIGSETARLYLPD